jgi:uncharacterized protein (TIGR02145 family)
MKKEFFLGIYVIILTLTLGMMSCKDEVYPVVGQTMENKFVATFGPENVTMTTASLTGIVSNVVQGDISESGFYLAEYANPMGSMQGDELNVLGKKYTTFSAGNKMFTVGVTDLKPNTTYKYVAFASNKNGTAYGEVKTLVTSYGTVTDAEGNVYQTVLIGAQEWMRENLKSGLYSDKTCINGCFNLETDAKLGKHYSWTAAVRDGAKTGMIQGACPTGWHIPSDADFQKLLKYVGVPEDQVNDLGLLGYDQACKLKDGGNGFWENSMIDNCTGFSVLPAGICNPSDSHACVQTAFWTSSPYIFYGFQDESEMIYRGENSVTGCGFSIRCIRDF